MGGDRENFGDEPMPSHFSCPHCGLEIVVGDQHAGEAGRCPHCGKPIQAPAAPPDHSFRLRGFSTKATLVILLGVVMLLGAFIAVLDAAVWTPAATEAKDLAIAAKCSFNLKQIARAMLDYEAEHGCFPPAYIADKNGKPMHSWRVLLLPYFKQEGLEALYKCYRMDEPWNSPNNRKVSDLTMALYKCPHQPVGKSAETNYVMVVGPHTISPGAQSRKLEEITDGLKNTIMLVEVADSGIRWAEPRDLRWNQIDFTINKKKSEDISSYHEHGVNVCMCNGEVRFLNDKTNPQLVKAMLTIDQGDHTAEE
jgi:hypothetical protein